MVPAARRRERALDRECLAYALDLVSVGVVFLDQDGSVIEMNTAAVDITDRDDGLAIRHNRLVAGRTSECSWLRDALVGSGEKLVTVLRRGGRRPYQVWVTRHRFGQSFCASAVALICDPASTSKDSVALLGPLYDLTPTESRVAACLMDGCSVQEAARELGIGTGTAKTHLKRIFLKTHTRRQAQLVAFLMRGLATLRLIGDWRSGPNN